MNTFEFDAAWDEVKGKLRQRFAQLTDDDLAFMEGKGEETLGRLEFKLGMAREDLNDLLNQMKSEVAPARFKFDEAKAKVGAMAGNLKSRVRHAADDFKSAATTGAERAYEKAREEVRTWAEDGVEYVRESPRKALLGAFAAGFVVGLLIRR
jgi:uncharacterized protein YjbJ (UPF0337 family)